MRLRLFGCCARLLVAAVLLQSVLGAAGHNNGRKGSEEHKKSWFWGFEDEGWFADSFSSASNSAAQLTRWFSDLKEESQVALCKRCTQINKDKLQQQLESCKRMVMTLEDKVAFQCDSNKINAQGILADLRKELAEQKTTNERLKIEHSADKLLYHREIERLETQIKELLSNQTNPRVENKEFKGSKMGRKTEKEGVEDVKERDQKIKQKIQSLAAENKELNRLATTAEEEVIDLRAHLLTTRKLATKLLKQSTTCQVLAEDSCEEGSCQAERALTDKIWSMCWAGSDVSFHEWQSTFGNVSVSSPGDSMGSKGTHLFVQDLGEGCFSWMALVTSVLVACTSLTIGLSLVMSCNRSSKEKNQSMEFIRAIHSYVADPFASSQAPPLLEVPADESAEQSQQEESEAEETLPNALPMESREGRGAPGHVDEACSLQDSAAHRSTKVQTVDQRAGSGSVAPSLHPKPEIGVVRSHLHPSTLPVTN
mmetsp:Transcript_19281/g.30130  ORF Transcript_19281/g.30130 Transcript_19281/m.30130 type:complete len:482 (+) Transcript_19281:187-1632(+)